MNKLKNNSQNQLRQVVLLLAIAVILPTVCLLWFMTQAVQNERLAVRQRLVEFYQEKTNHLIEYLEEKRLQFEESIKAVDTTAPFTFFLEQCCGEKWYAEGVLIYDSNGKLLFPIINEPETLLENSEEAWHTEYVEKNYAAAAKQYEQNISQSITPDHQAMLVQLAMIRCYEKGGEITAAIDLCRQIAYPKDSLNNKHDLFARLKLIQLYKKAADNTSLQEEAAELLKSLTSDQENRRTISAEQMFALRELLKVINEYKLSLSTDEITLARKIFDAGTISLEAADILTGPDPLSKLPEKTLIPLELDIRAYAVRFEIGNRPIIFIVRKSSMVEVMSRLAEELCDSAVAVSVFDENDKAVWGINNSLAEAFLTVKPSPYLGKWKLAMFFRSADVFEDAASKQSAVYIWSGLLVVLLIIISAAIAAQAISRQIKLTRLKNDFIATVTHELKTPLSSMRVLVDTLLDGRCQSRQQETEYLALIAKENLRLSKLIDNFLTFSRMERNKQVFDIAPTSPVEIANNAAEAVRTKFEKANVKFSLDVHKPLPMIEADKDALVTVLVNLLDNAYKYSYDNKEIELKVFADNGPVCFSVRDNGIGLTRRQVKKIFDRFYQADTSLSRRAEGAGLGLAIVKFIVNAHKGKIEVESKIGKGSVFTIKLTTN